MNMANLDQETPIFQGIQKNTKGGVSRRDLGYD